MIATVAGSDAFRAVHEARPTFRAFVARAFGDEGRRWLAALPDLTAAAVRRFGLVLGDELPGGSLSYVAAATTADGRDVVLKLGGPWASPADEARALERWAGDGAVALLDLDGTCALLLERVRPGTPGGPGDAAAVAALLARLHLEPLDGLPCLAEAARARIDRAEEQGRASPAKAAWARAAVARLEADPPPPVLLHGDLDHRNLLVCDRRGLVAIDPLPCVGDAAYDAGHWVHANRRAGRRARLDAIVAASGLPRDRVRDWAAVVGVHG